MTSRLPETIALHRAKTSPRHSPDLQPRSDGSRGAGRGHRQEPREDNTGRVKTIQPQPQHDDASQSYTRHIHNLQSYIVWKIEKWYKLKVLYYIVAHKA